MPEEKPVHYPGGAMARSIDDDLITDHSYQGELRAGASCQYHYAPAVPGDDDTLCARQALLHTRISDDSYVQDHPYEHDRASGRCGYVYDEEFGYSVCRLNSAVHANPGNRPKFLVEHPHDFLPQTPDPSVCGYMVTTTGETNADVGGVWRTCGFPERLHHWAEQDRRAAARAAIGALVRKADVAQYERAPMPDAARKGPVVTLIDAPVDPLGTLAVIGGIYTGQVARAKSEVTDDARRTMLADMQQTVLDGPLEAIQFTFLVEGVSRAIANQMTRNRFAFFAQESLRFAVAEDWAQEVPLPPSLTSAASMQNATMAGLWRKALNASEDAYNALIGAGMPAEEARGVLPLDITTRLYWTVSLRTLLKEAGKRTCTQAQFPWRQIFGGVAKALRDRAMHEGTYTATLPVSGQPHYQHPCGDGWQYTAFADLMRPVCYQQGKCGFMAKFDRGCTIRERVDRFAANNIPSDRWDTTGQYDVAGSESNYVPQPLLPIDPAEWAADPSAARVVEP